MKKRYIKYLIFILTLGIYLIIGKKYDILPKCPIYYFFKVHCPGCGVTRMLFAIFKLNFYQAFRYNPLLFILFPFAVFLFVQNEYSFIKKKKSIYKGIPNKVWYALIVILLIYGVLRNIISYLAPTII